MFRSRRDSILLLVCFFAGLAWTRGELRAEDGVGQPARVAANFKLLPGFQAELIYTVPKQRQGSWVNLTVDGKGRLITSDQYGRLYRVTPPAPGDRQTPTKVEPIDLNIGQAQGLLCAFDSLYVVVNGKAAHGSGLYRLRATDGGDHYDKVELLRRIAGDGEHGPHAVVLTPDGKSLLVIAGNFTNLPSLSGSLLPRNWGEDLLGGRVVDPHGFASNRMAPGGWICRVDPDGKNWELYSGGYRNPFDMAVNPEGEVFTYDADMEWDVGLPWYRPTRVNHVTSGSEYGWRNGSGKWPPYYPDSLPPVVEIGLGSPTGIVFGTGAKFPAKYQRALLMCDWSYGQLYAAHLTPAGSSYTATFETFATASPLPLTDVIVNPKDGALYFTVGGRVTDSALYRITYIGPESTAPAPPQPDAGAAARAERHKLEALHHAGAPSAVETAWPYLASPDRFLRYAARIAIEHQPVAEWQQRALAEQNPAASITAMIALARCGDRSLEPQIVAALGRVDFGGLDSAAELELLRAYGLAFVRLGRPDDALRTAVLARLDSHYPAASPSLNRELSQLLAYLDAPGVVARTLKLLSAAPTQEEQIQYVFALRNLRHGWSLDQRRAYFEWFVRNAEQHGGVSFGGYLSSIRREAVATLSREEKLALKSTLDKRLASVPAAPTGPPRKFVKKWTTSELVQAVQSDSAGRNFARGAALYTAASCIKCHRVHGAGGVVGPDLTAVGHRFSVHDLVESIVEPSKVVSDQYQMTIFVLKNGKTVVGRVANLSGNSLSVATDMLDPEHFTDVQRSDIEESKPSKISPMPEGLVDTFSRDEILDLVAYLRSGGSPDDPAFKRPVATAAPLRPVGK